MTITGNASDLVDERVPSSVLHLSQPDVDYVEGLIDGFTSKLESEDFLFDMTTGKVKLAHRTPDYEESKKSRVGLPLGAWVYLEIDQNEKVPDRFCNYNALIVNGIHKRFRGAKYGAN